MKKITFYISCVLLSLPCIANPQPRDMPYIGHWEFTGYLSIPSFNSEQAAREGIDDSALGLGTTADYFAERWITSLGLELMLYDDKASFSQTVVGTGAFNDGDISTEESDADALLFFAAFGPYWQFGQDQANTFSLQAGFSTVTASERSIANCSNCYDQDIEIDGGGFLQAGLTHSWNSVSLGFHIARYLDGEEGLENNIRIAIGTAF